MRGVDNHYTQCDFTWAWAISRPRTSN